MSFHVTATRVGKTEKEETKGRIVPQAAKRTNTKSVGVAVDRIVLIMVAGVLSNVCMCASELLFIFMSSVRHRRTAAHMLTS